MITTDQIQAESFSDRKFIDSILEILGEDYHCRVKFTGHNMEGPESLQIIIWGKNPQNNIALNSPVYLHLMMHLRNSRGKFVNMENVSWIALNSTSREVKFRKITSTVSIEEANQKLLQWLRKQRPNFDKLMERK